MAETTLPGQPVEAKEHEEHVCRGPEPPVLAGREQQAPLGDSRQLLAPLLHLQQQGHLLAVLLLMLVQELLGDLHGLVIHPQRELEDAQHHQDFGESSTHGLEEEGQKGLSRAGWEMAPGVVGQDMQERVGEGAQGADQ